MPAKDRRLQRQDVLDAAGRVFVGQGYVATTMSDLADAIPMSRPALYLLYPSREAIFAAVAARLPSTGAAGEDNLALWLAKVLDLWLGAVGANCGRDRQSAAVTLKQQALLCAVLKDGLAQRIGAEVGEEFQNAIVQLIALCVRGLQDAQIGTMEGKALLDIQVNALATMASAPKDRLAAWTGDGRHAGFRQS